jgi:uncharacterized protein (TIGR03000 family)
MLGLPIPRLRTLVLTLAGLLLASGVAWAHGGGGGHGGGGHGGGGHGGGIGHGGGFAHHGVAVGGIHHYGIYSPGFYRGLGYSPYFGRGYPYGFGIYGLGYGYSLGYGRYGLGAGWGYPYYPYYGYGLYRGYGWPSLGYSAGWYGAYPYSYYGYGSNPYYGYSSSYSPTPADYGAPSAQAQAPSPPKDDMAHLLVLVPENAELWFNGTKTTQTGPQREFVSPALTPGKHYSYEIKARWQENDKTVEQVRTVHVQANDWQTVDFTKPAPSAQTEK